MKKFTCQQAGKIGGSKTSAAKKKSSARNGKKGGRPISKYKYFWIGFTPVKGAGPAAATLKKLGFFRGGENLGFTFLKPCGFSAVETILKMREKLFGHKANIFTDANWKIQKLTRKQKAKNFLE